MKKRILALVCVAATVPLATSRAAVLMPYAVDDHTIALYHFEETAGVSDPGTPFANLGSGGSALNLTNTGGPDGRDNDIGSPSVVGGGYGAVSYTGLGSAFNPVNAGDGTIHSGTSGSAKGGGALTVAATVPQSALQVATGAFTYEALIKVSSIAGEQSIISHDNGSGTAANRGFNFGIVAISGVANLRLGGKGTTLVSAAIPLVGDNAWDPNTWYHVAVTYTGEEGVADNIKLYWTAVNDNVTLANQIGNATLTEDLGTLLNGNPNTPNVSYLGIGTNARSPNRFEVAGLVDEVRISDVARAADEFAVAPEPASLSIAGLGAMGLMHRRRRVLARR